MDEEIKWIQVKDELPMYGELCIFCFRKLGREGDVFVQIGVYDGGDDEGEFLDSDLFPYSSDDVICWRTAPPLPENILLEGKDED